MHVFLVLQDEPTMPGQEKVQFMNATKEYIPMYSEQPLISSFISWVGRGCLHSLYIAFSLCCSHV